MYCGVMCGWRAAAVRGRRDVFPGSQRLQAREQQDWAIGFRFSAGPDAIDLAIGSFIGISNKELRYLWVRYAGAKDDRQDDREKAG